MVHLCLLRDNKIEVSFIPEITKQINDEYWDYIVM